MSTDWGIGCRDCFDTTKPHSKFFAGKWDNCRSYHLDTLRAICAAAPEIVALADKLGQFKSVSLIAWNADAMHNGYGTCYGIAEFMREHAGHRLDPMNEYGQFDDQCADRVTCQHCGVRRHARLRSH